MSTLTAQTPNESQMVSPRDSPWHRVIRPQKETALCTRLWPRGEQLYSGIIVLVFILLLQACSGPPTAAIQPPGTTADIQVKQWQTLAAHGLQWLWDSLGRKNVSVLLDSFNLGQSNSKCRVQFAVNGREWMCSG